MATQPHRIAAAHAPVRRALLRLQRGVQRRMQAEVRAFTGGPSPGIQRYYREYLKEFRRFQGLSTYGELFDRALGVDLVYVGDYHTLRQSQQVAHRLLDRLSGEPRPVVLAMEMICAEHQAHVDAYMAATIDERTFLERIEYERRWNFDWANYRPLFELARQQGIRVLGINHRAGSGGRSLRTRDARIAASLADAILAAPDARFVVLIGELHLASNHLPRAVDRRLCDGGRSASRLIVYQNSDTLYWHLTGAGEDSQVVRLDDGRFCVMEVPPFVKLQSYLSWEQAVDRFEIEPGEELEEPTSATLVSALVRQLSRFFELPAPNFGCEVYTNLDQEFFDAVERLELAEDRLLELQFLVFSNRSCSIPEHRLVYLPFFSVNHAAEEAMQLLQHELLRSDGSDARSPRSAFYERVLRVAFAFLASKLVNPRRVATRESQLRDFLRQASRLLREPRLDFRKRVARLVVQHKDYERRRALGEKGRLQQIYREPLEVQIEVGHALAGILAESLHECLLAGELDRTEVRDALCTRERDPSRTYFDLEARVRAGSSRMA